MRRTKYLFITLFSSCMVVCLSAPPLRAGSACSAIANMHIALTHEQILSEFNPATLGFPGNFYLGDVPSQISYRANRPTITLDSNFFMGDTASQIQGFANIMGDAVPDIGLTAITLQTIGVRLPNTSKPATEAETESNVESVLDHLQPFVLEGGPVKENRAVEKAKEKLYKGADKIKEKRRKLDKARERVYTAGEELGKALNDAMDAEPGSKEAKEAAKKVEDAAKEAQEAGQEEEDALKELKKACEEAEGNYEAYEEAGRKAYEEAEKQNEAAQEAAEKAYEATGHGTSNKR